MVNEVRRQHLRVPDLLHEKVKIEEYAKSSGVSVVHILFYYGQVYELQGVTDYERVSVRHRISDDVSQLGGLLKWWLTDEIRTASFGADTIQRLLARIEDTQDQMADVMKNIVRPRADR